MTQARTKWEKAEPGEGKRANRNASRANINAWCYRCASEHRWEEPCRSVPR